MASGHGADRAQPFPCRAVIVRRGLYLVTPDWDDTERLVRVTREAILGGAVCVQYRHKTASAALKLEQAAALLEVSRELVVPLIINDDLALAESIGADGVHLGRDDGDVALARASCGRRVLIGVSCYNDLDRAHAAADAGANYVAFGAMFPSPTKPLAVPASTELIRQAKATLAVPVACIGGITAENAPSLVAEGADWLAVITDVYNAPNPRARAQAFARLFV